MLVILQHIAISPLDKGQLQTHFYLQKSIGAILTLPVDLLKGDIRANPSPTKLLYLKKSIGAILTLPEDLLKGDIQANPSPKLPPVPAGLPQKDEHPFHPIIIKAAAEHEIDPALIKAIIMAESGYNPKAISKKGAAGLMQLMPGTAAALGVEDIFNPEHNINGGVLYFKRMVKLFEGDVKLALAAYNAGARKVKMYKGVPPFKETQYYIKNVFKYYERYRQQMSS